MGTLCQKPNLRLYLEKLQEELARFQDRAILSLKRNFIAVLKNELVSNLFTFWM